VATSPDDAGTHFFYVNTLERRELGSPASEDEPSPRSSSSERASWFTVSCCPTNIARTVASLSAYAVTTSERGVQLHQYLHGRIDAELADGSPIALDVRTNYPDDGRVTVTVLDTPSLPWTLRLRVPAWAEDRATVTIAGSTSSARGGSVELEREFQVGDVIELTLPMEPRFTVADPRIDALRSQVAVERGPLVYCLESIDLPDDLSIDGVDVDRSIAPVDADTGRVAVTVRGRADRNGGWPYSPVGMNAWVDPGVGGSPRTVQMLPYNSWAERGPSTMRVWLPESLT
jgi:hypothetical protein